MRNLNPASGLKQISRGYLCFQRFPILKMIREGTIKPSELGYYVIFVMSADWDKDKYRKGFIRHELPKLSKIWNISYSTLNDNLNNLITKGLITRKKISQQSTPSITNFSAFLPKSAKESTKQNLSNEELKNFFSILLNDYEIPEQNQTKGSDTFKDSPKGTLSDNNESISNGDKRFINDDIENSMLNILK